MDRLEKFVGDHPYWSLTIFVAVSFTALRLIDLIKYL